MFPVTRPHISWLKIHDSSDDAVEDKALDKQYEDPAVFGDMICTYICSVPIRNRCPDD